MARVYNLIPRNVLAMEKNVMSDRVNILEKKRIKVAKLVKN